MVSYLVEERWSEEGGMGGRFADVVARAVAGFGFVCLRSSYGICFCVVWKVGRTGEMGIGECRGGCRGGGE